MRIIAGTARGRKLFSPGGGPKNHRIRPTSDRAREALFSIIASRIQDASVLDLFAGTGALGLEALSRGAAWAVFVDSNQNAITLVRKNIAACGFSERSLVIKRDLSKGLSFLDNSLPPQGFSLVFLDPPYGEELCGKILFELGRSGIVCDNGLVIAEDTALARLPSSIGPLHLADQRRYGDTAFWMYTKEIAKNDDTL